MIGLSAIDALKQNPVYQEFPFDDNNLRKSEFLEKHVLLEVPMWNMLSNRPFQHR